MKTPGFWRSKGALSTTLLPLSLAYRAMHRSRMRGLSPKALPVPVICVGNATVGGAGKTPVTIALLEWLQEHGVAAQCISRGYGGSLHGPVRVNTQEHTAAETGDEPLVIAQHAPCWVGKHRLSAATAAVLDGAQCIVMDDGLQNPTVKKSLSFLVIDGGYGFGNGRIMPAGPLRESVGEAAAKAQAAILIGEDEAQAVTQLSPEMPVLKARLVPQRNDLAGRRVVAFAGIGRPEKFFVTLERLGAEVAMRFAFADHHMYGQDEIQGLINTAQSFKAVLITTQKDAMRLTPEMRAQVEVLPVRLEFDDESALFTLCKGFLPLA